METSEHGRFQLSITLDSDYYSFIKQFIAAGVFTSPDEMIAAALDALSSAIEASARQAAAGQGYPDTQEASLEELADMLDRPARWREN